MRRRWHGWLVVYALQGGCSLTLDFYDGVACDSPGNDCPDGYRCILGTCRDAPAQCGDFEIGADEECDDGNLDDSDGCVDCREARCGDGAVRRDVERCDDGNQLPGDGCRPDCNGFEECGDARLDVDEECDSDGTSTLWCDPDCTLPVCGDGFWNVFANEACDDGNLESGDECRGDCLGIEVCGDALQDVDEICDTGNNSAACDDDCTLPACGDGLHNSAANEECDDGAANSDSIPDACRSDCALPWCGDGILDAGEACDDGPDNDDTLANACRTTCELAGCGDGTLDSGEECDRGAANYDIDDCTSGCTLAVCGDGRAHTMSTSALAAGPLEACDRGAQNTLATTGCSPDCSLDVSYPFRLGAGTTPDVAVTVGGEVGVVYVVDTDIYLTVWDAEGHRITDAGGVRVNEITTGSQQDPRLATLADGTFVIVWTDRSASPPEAYATAVRLRRVGADGVFTDPEEVLINGQATLVEMLPRIATAGDTAIIVNQRSVLVDRPPPYFDYNDYQVRAYAIGGTGGIIDQWIVTSVSRASLIMDVAILPSGHWATIWAPNTCDDSDPSLPVCGVRGRVYNAAGVGTSCNLPLNDAHRPVLASALDRFLVAWTAYSTPFDSEHVAYFVDTSAQHVAAAGRPTSFLTEVGFDALNRWVLVISRYLSRRAENMSGSGQLTIFPAGVAAAGQASYENTTIVVGEGPDDDVWISVAPP